VYTLLDGAKRLQKLTLSVRCSESLWQACAQLPLLREFSLNPRTCSVFSRKATFSPTLLSFSIDDIPDAESLTGILHNTRFPGVQKLSIDFLTARQITHPEAVILFSTIAQCCPLGTLEHLWIGHRKHGPFTAGNKVLPEALRSLLCFPHMRSLVLSAEWYWDLDDELICDMAQTWPKLEDLYLDPSRWWPTRTRITLQGSLPALATHCPHLIRFGAGIRNASTATVFPLPLVDIKDNDNHVPALRLLCLSHSKIMAGSVEVVAAYLSSLFPRLMSIETYNASGLPSGDPHVDRWSEVEILLPEVQALSTHKLLKSREETLQYLVGLRYRGLIA